VWEAAANLAGLDLSNNSLQQLPADHLVLCRNLRVLDASRNRLTVWPLPPQCVLPALEQLTLAHNPIRGPLPPHALDGVGAALRSLDLSGIAVRLLYPPALRLFRRSLRRRLVRLPLRAGAGEGRCRYGGARDRIRGSGAWARHADSGRRRLFLKPTLRQFERG